MDIPQEQKSKRTKKPIILKTTIPTEETEPKPKYKKLVKGSIESKEYMSKLRALRKKKTEQG